MGTVCSSVRVASISRSNHASRVRVFSLNTKNDPSLCWILAYRACGSSSSPRHKPTRNVSPIRTLATPTYQVLHRLAVLTDLRFHFMTLDPVLFPDIPRGIKVHSGFAVEHKKTANQILTEVERLMDEHSSNHVILVRLYYSNSLSSRMHLPSSVLYPQIGHSLGGGIAELDTLFMTLNLPEGTTIRGFTFGTPRVGNHAWATFFDSQVSNFTRVNNKRDPVPVVPGRLLGFRHVATEVYIQPDGKAVICPGE